MNKFGYSFGPSKNINSKIKYFYYSTPKKSIKIKNILNKFKIFKKMK